MARGGLCDAGGTVVAVIDAASGLDVHYMQGPTNTWYTFAPDPYCNVGDHFTGAVFVYSSNVPPAVTPRQAVAAFTASGFGAQIQTAINAAVTANKNGWQPPGVTAADAIVTAAATAIPLTATQVRSILQAAVNYTP